ncbi:hypothetical protein CHS0354_013081 [Potamilus streckersoni]|uniref:Heparan sulfate glucosamine 3-O-sulfotransferase 5 n=1 Tax=Potamilus streckersoni TaxID=2493646 RepID=A0AAE0SG15_9BIVA|nr:hypothetical protein CHS0354_013081 [Potamilus streckersoni]
MGVIKRQLYVAIIVLSIFLVFTFSFNSYVWSSLKTDSKLQNENLSGYGFRKLLEDDKSPVDRPLIPGSEKRLPQCIIVGARKCGTRALLEFLSLHPQIKVADMEMHFFDDDENYTRGLAWYQNRMPYALPGQITIEKTPRYFIAEKVPQRIQAMNSSVKLIVILRNPSTRVVSDYAQVYANKIAKNKTVSRFEDVVIDPRTSKVNTQYKAVRISLYYYHLSRWYLYFRRHQIHIVDGDNLITHPLEEIREVEKFLGLSHGISEDRLYFNETRGFYCMKFQQGEHCLGATKGRKHPDIDPDVLQKLHEFFRPHNKKLFDVIQRQFDWN